MGGRPVKYSSEELAFVKQGRKKLRTTLHADFVSRFGRADVTLKNIVDLCKRRGWRGTPHVLTKEERARGQFKVGHVPVTLGAPERVNEYGYVMMRLDYDPAFNRKRAKRRWVRKHRWLWEQKHGPIPERHFLKCKGNPLNTDPENWELIPFELLPRLNGCDGGRNYDSAPAELKPTILAVTNLEYSLRQKAKGSRHTRETRAHSTDKAMPPRSVTDQEEA